MFFFRLAAALEVQVVRFTDSVFSQLLVASPPPLFPQPLFFFFVAGAAGCSALTPAEAPLQVGGRRIREAGSGDRCALARWRQCLTLND